MTDENAHWSEDNSRLFINYARYFVPDRAEQIHTLGSLIPDPGLPFPILELSCGEGLLAEALLARYPHCTVTGLDGSQEMLNAATQRLAPYGDRFQSRLFDLADQDWRTPEPRWQAVVSSLAIHHLDGPGKAALFRDVFAMLRPGGALLIADVLLPAGPRATRHAADTYDEIVRRQSMEMEGNLRAFEYFERESWNLFRYPDDSIDKPSTIFDQLKWLEAAGFVQVDVFWLRAGHAIFGGYRPARSA